MPERPAEPRKPAVSRWENSHRDGTHWVVEIEADMWNYEEEGLVVSILTEDSAPDEDDAMTLVMASSEQAREMAAELLACADRVDRWHAEHPPPRVHVP